MFLPLLSSQVCEISIWVKNQFCLFFPSLLVNDVSKTGVNKWGCETLTTPKVAQQARRSPPGELLLWPAMWRAIFGHFLHQDTHLFKAEGPTTTIQDKVQRAEREAAMPERYHRTTPSVFQFFPSDNPTTHPNPRLFTVHKQNTHKCCHKQNHPSF